MKEIDLQTWPRKPHFDFFRTFQDPFFDVAARLDVSDLIRRTRAQHLRFYPTFMHAVMTAVNQTPALRLRFRGDRLFDVERCDCSFTIMGDNGLFNYAEAAFHPDLDRFTDAVDIATDAIKSLTTLNLRADGAANFVYVTSIPWTDILSLSHPFPGDPDDCVPRIAWGKIVEADDRFECTVQLTVHHALADGVDAALFLNALRSLV